MSAVRLDRAELIALLASDRAAFLTGSQYTGRRRHHTDGLASREAPGHRHPVHDPVIAEPEAAVEALSWLQALSATEADADSGAGASEGQTGGICEARALVWGGLVAPGCALADLTSHVGEL
jgi:hypothetical protein